MKHGTLSNVVQGRFLVLWENVLALLPDGAAQKRFAAYDRLGMRGPALREWRTNAVARSALTDMAYRRSIPVDLVSMLDPGYSKKLTTRVEHDAIPVSNVLFHTEESLDEFVRLAPYVVGIIHPYVNRPFLFGGKGMPVEPGKAWGL